MRTTRPGERHGRENDTAGVWFDGANASPGAETMVTGNTIWRNGQPGITLHSSNIRMDHNTIVNNGRAGFPGISAIHRPVVEVGGESHPNANPLKTLNSTLG